MKKLSLVLILLVGLPLYSYSASTKNTSWYFYIDEVSIDPSGKFLLFKNKKDPKQFAVYVISHIEKAKVLCLAKDWCELRIYSEGVVLRGSSEWEYPRISIVFKRPEPAKKFLMKILKIEEPMK